MKSKEEPVCIHVSVNQGERKILVTQRGGNDNVMFKKAYDP